MSIILGIDPGEKHGFVTRIVPNPDGPHFQREGGAFEWSRGHDAVVIERPDRQHQKGKKNSLDSVIGTGMIAGFQAREAMLKTGCLNLYRMKPSEWRKVLGLQGHPKDVIVNRLRRDLQLPTAWTPDQVEAAGIAEAFSRLTAKQQAKYRWKPKC